MRGQRRVKLYNPLPHLPFNRKMSQRLLTLILAVAPRKGLGSVKQEASPAPRPSSQLSPPRTEGAPCVPQPLCLCSPQFSFCSKTRGPTPEGGHPRLGHWHSALGGPPTTSSMMSTSLPTLPLSVSEGPGMSSTFPHLVF